MMMESICVRHAHWAIPILMSIDDVFVYMMMESIFVRHALWAIPIIMSINDVWCVLVLDRTVNDRIRNTTET